MVYLASLIGGLLEGYQKGCQVTLPEMTYGPGDFYSHCRIIYVYFLLLFCNPYTWINELISAYTRHFPEGARISNRTPSPYVLGSKIPMPFIERISPINNNPTPVFFQFLVFFQVSGTTQHGYPGYYRIFRNFKFQSEFREEASSPKVNDIEDFKSFTHRSHPHMNTCSAVLRLLSEEELQGLLPKWMLN